MTTPRHQATSSIADEHWLASDVLRVPEKERLRPASLSSFMHGLWQGSCHYVSCICGCFVHGLADFACTSNLFRGDKLSTRVLMGQGVHVELLAFLISHLYVHTPVLCMNCDRAPVAKSNAYPAECARVGCFCLFLQPVPLGRGVHMGSAGTRCARGVTCLLQSFISA